MASTATTRLRLEKQGLGDNSSTWGAPKLNTVLDLIDEAVGGVEAITISGTTTTLTSTNYASDQARNAVLVFTGTLSAASSVIVPNVEKLYLVVNNTSMGAYTLTIKTAAGSGVSLPAGACWVYCDATSVFTGEAASSVSTGVAVTSGVISAPLGSVSAPSYTFSGDTNTGLYSPGADAVSITVGGTARAAVSTTGLAVTGAVTASSTVTAGGVILGPAGSASAPSYSFSTDTNSGVYSGGADIVSLATGGTARVTVDASGNVGVGQTPVSAAGYTNISAKGTTGAVVDLTDTLGTQFGRLYADSTDGHVRLLNARATGDLVVGAGSGTERARVTAAGHLLVGQPSAITPGYSADTTVGFAIRGDGRLFQSAASFSSMNLNADGSLLLFNRSGVNVGNIAVTTTATAYNTSSDARLKDDIEPVTGALAQVAQVGPKSFRFKSEAKNAKKRAGFLAQDVAKVCPEAVTGRPDETGPDGKPVHMMIDYSKLVPILWAAVRELAARVEALEGQG